MGLLNGLDVSYKEALYEADRIIAWRSPVEPGRSDPEVTLYQTVGKAYGPRHGPFQAPEELAMVADLRPGLVERILPYVTVYSGRPEINVLVAPPPVLSAVPGVTPELLQLLVKAQQSNLQNQLGVVMQNVTLDAAQADRVTVTVRFRSGRIIRTQAVILLSNAGTEPYHVLSWRDDELSIRRSASRMQ